MPTALQSPADGQETEPAKAAPNAGPRFAGTAASIPSDQLPAVWVNTRPSSVELALYKPTAVQFPTEAQDTEANSTKPFVVEASDGKTASTPADQLPSVSLSSRPSPVAELSQ